MVVRLVIVRVVAVVAEVAVVVEAKDIVINFTIDFLTDSLLIATSSCVL